MVRKSAGATNSSWRMASIAVDVSPALTYTVYAAPRREPHPRPLSDAKRGARREPADYSPQSTQSPERNTFRFPISPPTTVYSASSVVRFRSHPLAWRELEIGHRVHVHRPAVRQVVAREGTQHWDRVG